MIRLFILAILVNLSAFTMAQSDIADIKEQNIQEVRVDRLFSSKYQTSLRRLRRTYPMALKAKELIEAYNEDLEFIEDLGEFGFLKYLLSGSGCLLLL